MLLAQIGILNVGERIDFSYLSSLKLSKFKNRYNKYITMEKGNINVIIFDDQQPSAKEYKQSRTVNSSKHISSSNNHHLDIIEQEIAYLSDKIKSLQQQTESALHLKSQSNLSYANSRLNQQPNQDHCKEIIKLVQKKIQIIVRETKKLVSKMGQNFEKKLEAKLSKKYDEAGLNKIKENYGQALKRIESGYKKEIEKLSKQHKQAEVKMLSRINTAQQRFVVRMNQFATKQKEYVDWIHHLEIQLKEKTQIQQVHQIQQVQQVQAKPKRMIEVTHASNLVHKKQNQQTISVLTGDNNSSTLHQNGFNQQVNDSKIQRRHKIFDPMTKSSSSVSPNQRVVSPLSVQPSQLKSNPLNNSKAQPEIKPRLTQKVVSKNQPMLTPVSRLTQPLKNNLTNNSIQNEASPWRAINKSAQKSSVQPTQRNKIVKQVNQEQFYKDVPKANQGWQKFQDFNQADNSESGSDSEEDVIFYRNDEKHLQFGEMMKENKWRQSNESKPIPNIFEQSKKESLRQSEPKFQANKIFSPFDLN